MQSRITLVPVGDVNEDVLQGLHHALKKVFKSQVCQYGVMKFPRDAYNPVRDQYLAVLILSRMRQYLSPGEDEKILGITEKDLYADEMNFVFGQAELPGRFALISLTRLHPSFYGRPEKKSILRQRAIKEAVHELGHNWGLKHCPNPKCGMHFSLTLKDTDNKNADFCDSCRSIINSF